MLLKEPILKYPDPNYGYILYTDASKYAWAGVLAWEYHYEEDGKTKIVSHPITYISVVCLGDPDQLGSPNQRSLCHIHEC